MKKKARQTTLFLIFTGALLASMAGCSEKRQDDTSGKAENHNTHTEQSPEKEWVASAPAFQVNNEFQDQLASLFASYVELKEAFVRSDVEEVKSEAQKTQENLSKVNTTLLEGAAQNDWKAYQDNLASALDKMQSSDDIEGQRKYFRTVSDNLYNSIKAFGLGGAEAYYEYCPMAFGNEGAYWLSDNSVIRNPYFGDSMLGCGEVKEKLQ